MNEERNPVRLGDYRKQNKVMVLFFVASTCPVTKLYWDRIKTAWEGLREQGAALILVGGNTDDSIQKVREILDERELEMRLVWDGKRILAKIFGVQFTPEVVVLGRNWEVYYRGRIDDHWRNSGAVKKNYLEDAVRGALEGRKSQDHVDDGFMGSRLR